MFARLGGGSSGSPSEGGSQSTMAAPGSGQVCIVRRLFLNLIMNKSVVSSVFISKNWLLLLAYLLSVAFSTRFK